MPCMPTAISQLRSLRFLAILYSLSSNTRSQIGPLLYLLLVETTPSMKMKTTSTSGASVPRETANTSMTSSSSLPRQTQAAPLPIALALKARVSMTTLSTTATCGTSTTVSDLLSPPLLVTADTLLMIPSLPAPDTE